MFQERLCVEISTGFKWNLVWEEFALGVSLFVAVASSFFGWLDVCLGRLLRMGIFGRLQNLLVSPLEVNIVSIWLPAEVI